MLTFLQEFIPTLKSGQKTVTRRLVKPQPAHVWHFSKTKNVAKVLSGGKRILLKCPYSIGEQVENMKIKIVDINLERMHPIEDYRAEGMSSRKDFELVWDRIYSDNPSYTFPWVWFIKLGAI